jgi:hypothetical protein
METVGLIDVICTGAFAFPSHANFGVIFQLGCYRIARFDGLLKERSHSMQHYKCEACQSRTAKAPDLDTLY